MKFNIIKIDNTQRIRCQLTRCNVDQHSSKVLSLIKDGVDAVADAVEPVLVVICFKNS